MLNIEIDGKPLEVEHGSTIIDAADAVGIAIPRFCYHKKLSVAANCRMCLVQVEKFNKPLPACATPVADGMKIYTRSKSAVEAQQSVMEFLLINHPLDCPICDQGGECDLQDIAVAYGASGSRYTEEKRVVFNKNIGPLVSTDMTRCIQCTRCVRFLKEVGGMQELGLVNRGEHAEITAYVDQSVNSELSGNIIDLCPVGALTSKPFRYSARSWELVRRPSIAPHDGLGSHIEVHVKDNKVMRVLPREKESINECWLSDRDRFSYEGLNSPDRLKVPMIKHNGQWQETDWKTALEFAAGQLKDITKEYGGEALGVLVSPNSTMEEGYLIKQLAEGLGSGNVDYRLRQTDFRLDGKRTGTPWMGCNIQEIEELDRILLIGSNLRNEHPLLAQRIRKAVANGAELCIVSPLDNDPLMDIAHKVIVRPNDMVNVLGQVLKAMSGLQKLSLCLPPTLNKLLEEIQVRPNTQQIAECLAGISEELILIAPKVGIFLGNMALSDPRFTEMYSMAEAIGGITGAKGGILPPAANSTGMHLMGVMPSATGMHARAMIEVPRKAYLLLNIEPELDCQHAALASDAMAKAECVIALTAYKSAALDNADILLPIAPFTETSGTFMSMEGRVQSFQAVTRPLGEARPGWKVLRVLANTLGLPGFDFNSSEDVKNAIFNGEKPSAVVWRSLNNNLKELVEIQVNIKKEGLQRIGEVPQYEFDPIVRRSAPLQKTKYNIRPMARMRAEQLADLGLQDGDIVVARQDKGSAVLKVRVDNHVAKGCVRVAAAHPLTAGLGDLMGDITIEKASADQVAIYEKQLTEMA
ncbi:MULTISPECIES: NADH-quinone oxidoreductase subunit NuoG [unclassified Methylophilus]|jgi:NADH-quinone oxidoreductase subunit G|uniref:NADH-quinone oxidoreductase subunit NuoG n=1 Tax=unclassified Methylophilus TaxID=2630143 RepID=UPI0004651044|nr:MULTISPECIES: NADH-quinone oxidoreductase subunit NuoG [unclassified Methylophilus]